MPKEFNPDLEEVYELPAIDSWPATRHRFDEQSVWGVRAALAAERPLLLRGEPGIGKSQLARAVAEVLHVPFLYHVVDERSERDDLLYSYDAVSRLAQAQLASVLHKDDTSWEEKMAEERFIRPGVLWWAFNWQSAQAQVARFFRKNCPMPTAPKGWSQLNEKGKERLCGSVVLIDEIDKADPSLPNGLLESLGNTGFRTAQLDRAVELPAKAAPPFVVITTNEERELPAAFLRRCFVLHMRFPPEGLNEEEFLLARTRVHYAESEIEDELCRKIVTMLLEDRREAQRHGLAKPGAAEFLDIAKVLVTLHSGDREGQERALMKVKDFALKKNLEEE